MDEKITLSLSVAQRELLLKYEPYFADHNLFRLISVSVKRDNAYEINLAREQLEDLLDQVSTLCNIEEKEKVQGHLDDLCDYLETFSDAFEDDEIPFDRSSNTGAVYTLKVALEGAPEIWRNIAIRGGQSLDDLHCIIFDAFDREEEHLYSFYVPFQPLKKRPRQLHKVCAEYTHPDGVDEMGFGESGPLDAVSTSIESLKLTPKQQLYYLFDFGDSWWHIITVEDTEGKADDREYPRIIERKGKSPAQYEYPDEENEDE
jgi:hypothetical protein